MEDKKTYRIIAMGDTHGRSRWKEIITAEKDSDLFILMGDYFDARDGGYSANRQIENFKDILAFKKSYPHKVIMLTGNHDLHYIKSVGETYSSYQYKYAKDIRDLVEPAIADGYMQMCYKYNQFLFTHAGLTKTWCKFVLGNDNPVIDDVAVKVLNDYLVTSPSIFKFCVGGNFSNSGDDITQGPVWVRPRSLLSDMVEGVTCVVGHTQVSKISVNPAVPNLIMIDCLGHSGEYLIIDDNKASVGI